MNLAYIHTKIWEVISPAVNVRKIGCRQDSSIRRAETVLPGDKGNTPLGPSMNHALRNPFCDTPFRTLPTSRTMERAQWHAFWDPTTTYGTVATPRPLGPSRTEPMYACLYLVLHMCVCMCPILYMFACLSTMLYIYMCVFVHVPCHT